MATWQEITAFGSTATNCVTQIQNPNSHTVRVGMEEVDVLVTGNQNEVIQFANAANMISISLQPDGAANPTAIILGFHLETETYSPPTAHVIIFFPNPAEAVSQDFLNVLSNTNLVGMDMDIQQSVVTAFGFDIGEVRSLEYDAPGRSLPDSLSALTNKLYGAPFTVREANGPWVLGALSREQIFTACVHAISVLNVTENLFQ